MLRAKYKCGSSVILPTSRDIDFVYYYDTEEERKNALIHNHDHSVDNHFCLYEKRTKVRLGCYAYPFMQHIEGEVIEEFATFSILEEPIKNEYIGLIKKHIGYLSKESKQWYHILIAYYMYKNGEMKLTSQQKEVVQNAHDRGITDTMYNKVVDYFNQLQ